jgi:exosortase A-associated hydrolase 2
LNSELLKAAFVDGSRGRLFVLLRGPVDATSAVLIVPPFAEEMNKARRMITDTGRELARRGTASICVDLFGTGDSEGDFTQTSWEGWIDDLAAVEEWCHRSQGLPITGVLAARLGCALAAAYAARRKQPLERWVFWQPVLDGTRYMDQFLRLKLAASMLGEGPKRTVADLRREIGQSGTLEIAGYALSADLLAEIDRVRLERVDARWPLHWFELVRDAAAPIPVPAAKVIERLRRDGCDVQLRTIACDPIWTSTEIVVSAALAAATAGALHP